MKEITSVEELEKRLNNLVFPCYLVAYGPDRDYRTRFRSEHHGAFNSGMANNMKQATSIVGAAKYPGLYSEMTIISITIEDNQLMETTF